MARMRQFIGLSLLTIVSFGCVSTEQYKAAKIDRDQLAERLAAAERGKDGSLAERDAYKGQLDTIMLTGSQKDALIVNQSNQINDLQRQLDELSHKYEDASKRVGQTVVLNPELNNALTEFARQNPDLVDFDSSRGIVKFKSDVTFATGSAELTAQAKSAIDRFAGILNAPSATGYELMVVGHTDNTPVQHQATLAAGHKDNWYLSAHRAISVGQELAKQNVSPGRLEVAGLADQRPVASNTTAAGKQMNRRVEVLILPTTVRGTTVANTTPPPSAPRKAPTPKAQPSLNKDTSVDSEIQKPAFNK